MAIRSGVFIMALSAGTVAQADMPTSLPKICKATTPAAIAAMINRTLPCGFDRNTMTYAGTPVEQARCLLRIAAPTGGLTPEKPLPQQFEHLVGQKITITSVALGAYLKRVGVDPADIGGSDLTKPLSVTAAGKPAAYFVIHDTSTPNYETKPFGPEIDSTSWSFNANLKRWQMGDQSIAHVFIARTGNSVTALDYGTPWRATRTETCVLGVASRGLFIHNELVQPRRSNPRGAPGNDGLAPSPPFRPFQPEQLDRLALAYIAVSVRAGHWLIPAFHASIDETIPGGHDDPRDFDLADWVARVGRVIDEINKPG
jgi:hypothetical protein